MSAGAALRRLRDGVGDTYLLALARIGFGLLLLNEAWLAITQLREAGYFGVHFHQPFLPESLVPSEGVYTVILGAQFGAAVLVVSGRVARPALLVAAGLLVYVMLCDRLWFHHYRHTLAAFSTLLAFAPCDRQLVLGRAVRQPSGPVWAQSALRAQVSLMYLASGGSKLFDPDWRGGQMMVGMVKALAGTMLEHDVPASLVSAAQTPLGGSVLAKAAIGTELALAFLLQWPRTRRLGVWVGLGFHLIISQITPVRLFTLEMLVVYLLFATPDTRARTVRYDPGRHWLVPSIESLDWLRRFRLVSETGSALVVVDRDGREKRGLAALAVVAGAVPLLFPLWPLLAILAALAAFKPGSPRGAS